MKKPVILTIDVEEWWSVESFKKLDLLGKYDKNQDRISTGIERILNLLKQNDVFATFFVLGRVAQNHPKVVEKIVEHGHEIGTHGYSHKLVYNQSEKEFESDLKKSLLILEIITGSKIESYRAPSYSLTKDSIWALKILFDNGIIYDSSIVPTSNDRFGIKNTPQQPYEINLQNGNAKIIEVPPSVIGFFNRTFPVASGIAFRFFPKFVINRKFDVILRKNSYPMIIVHNWELDPDHPQIDAGIRSNFIHYYNIKGTKKKLEYFVKNYQIVKLTEHSECFSKIELEFLAKEA